MFKRLLIANRGEIACRILKTAQAMGIHCTLIYSEADAHSRAVRLADNALCLGPAPASESYLNIAKIIGLAEANQIEAIHPGYGFLSENADFARACAEAGIIFIGPSLRALESMASKQLAKQLLQDTDVPLTPGYHGDRQDEQTLREAAEHIGFPVLLKAAMGGGGKGMRAVHQAADFSMALAGAKREAKASFGDEKMIIEKLVEQPRHVEVQIMADQFGNVVHMFERDCSVQRRHQKIVEEAPAPGLNDTLRHRMQQAAITVARTIEYQGAGTVEFLLSPEGEFYFMEMNTRLQVEHPVSEMITGLDFVAWQLHIANGEPLPLPQEAIQANGHAIECRIYAEDPDLDFMPAPGTIHYLKEPCGEGIRVDSGIEQGDSISRYYDPMIAKLISHGDNRTVALSRLQKALCDYHIAGVKHNIPFLRALTAQPAFVAAKVHTGFLQQHPLNLPKLSDELALQFAVCHDITQLRTQKTDPLLRDAFAWSSHEHMSWYRLYQIQQKRYPCQITPLTAHSCQLQVEELKKILHWEVKNEFLRIEDEPHGFQQASVVQQADTLYIFHRNGQATLNLIADPYETPEHDQSAGQLTAPMPATVVALLKNEGDRVKAGESLLVLEAMKMEHTIKAPSDGIISNIFFSVGQQVDEGVQLMTLADSCKEHA
ncbi:MAG: acetyl-CoA carboxylase biotin carboxylase subunit [Legionellaceae bacterium]|nr:acetyl-CoA carboxylase biotin carboxylase subunit [Legionellaceae bacterium]